MYKVEEMNLTIGKLLGVVVTIRFSRPYKAIPNIVYAECMATDLTLYHGDNNNNNNNNNNNTLFHPIIYKK